MKRRMKLLLSLLLLSACNMAANEQEEESPLTYEIGSFDVTVLPEGGGQGNTDILIGATPEMLTQSIPEGTYSIAVNAFLIETDDKAILVDAGYGKKLFANLEACEKSPEQIDIILLTHMHGDHIGGLLQNDKKSFPNATLYISQSEYDYWTNDEADNAANARKVIEAYKNNLQLFVPDELEGTTTEIFPGIRGIAAYGHTPGHTVYLLESDGSKLFIWGDLTHAMAIQIPYPEVAVTYDVNPTKAIESRQRILQYVTDNKIDVAGMHIQFPGIGNIRKNKSNEYIFNLTCDCEGMAR